MQGMSFANRLKVIVESTNNKTIVDKHDFQRERLAIENSVSKKSKKQILLQFLEYLNLL